MPLSHQSIVAVNLPGPGIVAGEGGGFVIVFLLKWLTMSKTISYPLVQIYGLFYNFTK